MKFLSRWYSFYKNDKKVFVYRIFNKTCSSWMSDALYLKFLYWLFVGKRLNLINPQTYTEKLQWLKIYDHNPLYTTMVDKYAVKQFVAEKIGEEYVIPTFGVWDSLEEVEFDSLPNQFVLKTTFGGGGYDLVICKDKTKQEKDEIIDYMKGFMKQDQYRSWREWPYKNVPRRILAEKYLEEPGKSSLTDYKVLCFNGEAKLIELHNGRYTDNHTQDFYDCKWNKMPITQGGEDISDDVAEKPKLLNKMIQLSNVLSKDIPHVRVDWYIINSQLYFGELTFYDASGFDPFVPDEYNYIIGDWIILPQMKLNN